LFDPLPSTELQIIPCHANLNALKVRISVSNINPSNSSCDGVLLCISSQPSNLPR